jgi:hypothetical protein
MEVKVGDKFHSYVLTVRVSAIQSSLPHLSLPPVGREGSIASVSFLLQELTNILGVFSYKLSAAFAHVHLLKFFPVGRIQ